jgi:hypothetical protein
MDRTKLQLLAVVALLAAVGALLAGNAGAYPQIAESAGYQVLALFVAANTVGFALWAALKMGYHGGRQVGRPQPPAARSYR